MRDWAGVIEDAKKLENSRFKLESDPATPFTSYSNNMESIFSIANSSDDNASVNGAMSSMMSARDGGRAMCPSSPILYNSSFGSDDKRHQSITLSGV